MNVPTALLLLFALGAAVTTFGTLSSIMPVVVAGVVVVWHAVFGGIVLYFD